MDLSEIVGEFDETLPWFLADLAEGMRTFIGGRFLLFDFETTNIDKGDARNPNNHLVCAAWCWSDERKIHYCRGDEFSQQAFVAAVEEAIRTRSILSAHNVKFELHWLTRMGIDLYKVLCYDSMIAEWVIGGNRWLLQDLSLNKVSKRHGGLGKAKFIDTCMKNGVCPSQMRPDLLEARARQDVKQTWDVIRSQHRYFDGDPQLWNVLFTRMIVTPCLTNIEQQGIGLDKARVYEEYNKAEAEYGLVERELNDFTGGINFNSPPQVADYVYGELGFKELTGRGGKPKRNKASKKFPDGAPKVDKDTLDALKATNKRQRTFVDLKKRAANSRAKLTKTLQFFKGIVDEYDGVFYGNINQCTTRSHRLSSSGKRAYIEQFDADKSAQFQNFPRIFKDLMAPKLPGHSFGEADGSQLEFRAAAELGMDTQAGWNIRHDVDQHVLTASVLNEVAVEAVDKYMRQAGKPNTFKPLYGGRFGTPAEERYYAWFREEYSELSAEQERWCYEVLETGSLKTRWGMRYYWPGTRIVRGDYISNSTKISNYPIQAFATAEIIPVALVYLWHRLRVNSPNTSLVNTVHDSALAEIPEGQEETFKRLSFQTFTKDVYGYLDAVYDIRMSVPLGAGIIIGERWQSPDATEVELNVEPTGECWWKGDRKAA